MFQRRFFLFPCLLIVSLLLMEMVTFKRSGEKHSAAKPAIKPVYRVPKPPAPIEIPVVKTEESPPPVTEFPKIPDSSSQLYLKMTEEQKLFFIENHARRISRMIGNRECLFDKEVLLFIKQYVDQYARRSGTQSQRLWGEDLNHLFGRAAHQYAPQIIHSFVSENVPPVIGLYLAAIESEYHECLTSPVGAQGMFQFMPETAKGYGLPPDQRCDWERSSHAAALYMRDRLNQFGTDATSVSLAIAGYNRGPGSVMRDLENVINSENRERSFWILVANAYRLDHFFQKENINYVPKFFAAAIVGETPWAFGLDLKPLSTYREVQTSPNTRLNSGN